jgi:anti-sigma28 factor (negative regulator of flagellin synthesis)
MDINRTEGVRGPERVEGKRVDGVQPPSTQPTPAPVDRVEVSQAGQLVGEVLALPATRTEKIAELKAAVEAGTYQTDEKLLGALDSFLRENPDLSA